MPQRPNLSTTGGGNTSSASSDFAFDFSADVLRSCAADQKSTKCYDTPVKISRLELFFRTQKISSVHYYDIRNN